MQAATRVLLVEEASESGGAVMSLESLVSGPVADVEYVIALGGAGGSVGRLKARGFDVHVVPLQGWRWWESSPRAVVMTVLSFPLQIASLLRWRKMLREIRPQIVHLNSNRLVEPLLAARMMGIPVLVHFRDIPSIMTQRFLPGRAAFYRLMNLATCWIANSEASASDIRPYARVPLSVIPNGLDVVAFDSNAGLGPAAPRGVLHVSMIALINRLKRCELVIEVAAIVLHHRSDVVFSIVGAGDTAYINELRTLARDRGVGDRLRFEGHVENVPAYLQTVDVLIHTCPIESFGRVFLEAMAARKPVVAVAGGAAAEVVRDQETGFLVHGADPQAMASAVLRLLESPALRTRLGDAGRERVERCFSIDATRARVRGQYEQILSEQLPAV